MTAKHLNFERVLDVAALQRACEAIGASHEDPACLTARNELFKVVKTFMT